MRYPLIGSDTRDENGNQYPEIYTKILSSTNRVEPFYRTYSTFFAPLRERGFGPVDMSAYLDKSKFHLSNFLSEWVTSSVAEHEKIPGGPDDHDIVFVWDIEDITMLTGYHIEELSMLRPDIKPTAFYNLLDRICVDLNNLENLIGIVRGVDNIEDAFVGEIDEMRNAASMYDALRDLYNSVQQHGSKEKGEIISHDLFEKLGMVEQESEFCQLAKKHQKVYNQRWKIAKKCMELVNIRAAKSKTKKYANVVLCEEGIASGAAQLLISGLSSEVPIENIYSILRVAGEPNTWYRMKATVERLKIRFGEKCCLIFVTSGASFGNIPLVNWAIRANEMFKTLYKFQKDLLK